MPQSLYLARIRDAAVPAILAVATRRSGAAIVCRSALLLARKPPVLREVIRQLRASDRPEVGEGYDEEAVHELAILQAVVDAREASVLVDANDFRPTIWSMLRWWAFAGEPTLSEMEAVANHVCGIAESERRRWAAAISSLNR